MSAKVSNNPTGHPRRRHEPSSTSLCAYNRVRSCLGRRRCGSWKRPSIGCDASYGSDAAATKYVQARLVHKRLLDRASGVGSVLAWTFTVPPMVWKEMQRRWPEAKLLMGPPPS